MPYAANADLQDLFQQAPAVRMIDRLTKRVGESMTDEVKKRTPVAAPPPGMSGTQFAGSRGRAPGTLRESWYTGDLERGRGVGGVERRSIESLTDDPVAPHVEWPTRPHLIRPSLTRAPASVLETGRARRPGGDPAAALRFIGSNGRVVFAREVWHPGTQGQHMMRETLTETDATWVERHGSEELGIWAREQTELVR